MEWNERKETKRKEGAQVAEQNNKHNRNVLGVE